MREFGVRRPIGEAGKPPHTMHYRSSRNDQRIYSTVGTVAMNIWLVNVSKSLIYNV